MSNTIKIEIPEEMSNYIEGLMYEVNARKNLVAFCIERGMNLDNEIFKKYHDQYVEETTKYEIAKREMEKKYILPEYNGIKWNLDFDSHTLSIEVKENA